MKRIQGRFHTMMFVSFMALVCLCTDPVLLSAGKVDGPASTPLSMMVSTFLGGSGTDGHEYIPHIDMTSNADGHIFIAGITNSADFPVTPGAYQNAVSGDYDLFVAKFNADLTSLLAATLLGGTATEGMPRIHMDPEGNVVVVSHGISLKTIITAILAVPLSSFSRFDLGVASITYLHIDGDRTSLAMLNDTCHLDVTT